MQEQILFYFQSIASPFLDRLLEFFTMFGEETFIIAIIAWIYWNKNKKEGFTLSFALLVSLMLNNVLKIIFRTERPFQKLPGLTGKRLQTATGYSFPSGHTQGAASFYSSLFLVYKKWRVIIPAIIIIIFVAISRVYLGVHWPIDVIAAVFIGVISSIILVPFLNSIYENKKRRGKFLLILSILSATVLTVTIFTNNIIFKGDLDIIDLIKMSGLLFGVSWGLLFEMKGPQFLVEASLIKKIIRFVIGLVGAFLFMEGLKMLLPYTGFFHLVRYGLTGLWVVWFFPLIGGKMGLFAFSELDKRS